MGDKSQSKSKKAKELSFKQKMFVEHYLRTGNLSEAARQAGYSKRDASGSAQQLMDNPLIKAEVARRRSELINKTEIDVDSLVCRLYDIATTRATDLFDINQKTNKLTLKAPLNELPDNVKSSVRIQAELRKNQLVYKIDQLDPISAFDKLSKTLGLNEENINIHLGSNNEPVNHSISDEDSNAEAIRKYEEFIEGYLKQPKKE